MIEDNRRQALQLISDITHCPEVRAVWATDAPHPCRKVVETQEPDAAIYQVPEPWAGHLHLAPVLLVSSNPSISADEPYPTWNASAGDRVRFFDDRFGDRPGQVKDGVRFPLSGQAADGSWHSRRPVPFWRDCLRNVSFMLDRPARPGVDYVMTEVVHCKSRGERGVAQATDLCVTRWLGRVMDVSPAPVVVLLGAHAVAAMERYLGHELPLWQVTEAILGDRNRLILAARHPNFHGPRRWDEHLHPKVLARLRMALLDRELAQPIGADDVPHPDVEEHQRAEQRDASIVVALPQPVASLLDRVRASAPDSVRMRLRRGHLSLEDEQGSTLLSATGNEEGAIVGFRLRQGDAERAHAAHGGYLSNLHDAPHLRELSVDETHVAADPEAFYVLGVRALHGADPMSETALVVDDLVDALVEARRFADGPSDMQLYWTTRKDALWDLFGLAESEAGVSDALRFSTRSMIEHAVAALEQPSSPFAGIYEAPPEVSALMTPYVEQLEELEERRQQLGRAWIRDLLALIRPDVAEREVAAAEIAARGVAPRPPRDEVDLVMDGWF